MLIPGKRGMMIDDSDDSCAQAGSWIPSCIFSLHKSLTHYLSQLSYCTKMRLSRISLRRLISLAAASLSRFILYRQCNAETMLYARIVAPLSAATTWSKSLIDEFDAGNAN
jgi:hypothetical protein